MLTCIVSVPFVQTCGFYPEKKERPCIFGPASGFLSCLLLEERRSYGSSRKCQDLSGQLPGRANAHPFLASVHLGQELRVAAWQLCSATLAHACISKPILAQWHSAVDVFVPHWRML